MSTSNTDNLSSDRRPEADGTSSESTPGLAPDLEEPIEANSPSPSDTDSALGNDWESYTTSVTSSIWNYEYENGRRYHAFRRGQYVIPNDEQEQERLDFLHHIHNMTFGGRLFLAPIGDNPQRVLDVGTGTGIWAINFADTYPSAEVIGIDLSGIQPHWVPPNLHFQIDDIEAEWTFPHSQPFDFIKIRSMAGSIANWEVLLQQAYDHMAPGAWIEVQDFEAWASTDDNSLPDDSNYAEFQRLLDEASTKFGRKMNIAPHHKKAIIDAGFENVVADVKKVPLSPWAKDPKLKELGRYMQVQMLDAVEAYALALLSRVLGWDAIRVHALLAGVRKDLRNLDYHMYSKCHSVYGQKPFKNES
ncbi:putative methyltransferase [Talaromyces proteolyticus]|uniref:Methyltransferase n=1 Tax=Talaromyces proteolyticus TaxID=1131652 RepID=A0AAD4PT96_9EURO|nr:putative methyltransferase [Talaromyces proteolyticus]KAH8692925.1 putative methyltransferase [Talaromyces proteolyticus]